MKKFTKKVHHEETTETAVWVRQEAGQSKQKQNQKHSNELLPRKRKIIPEDETEKLPIVYSGRYAVRFCGLEKLHPFDAAKGQHIVKHLKSQDEQLQQENFFEPNEITKSELRSVHTKKYLRSLKWSLTAARISEIPPLLFVPNPIVQRGYLRPMRFQTAGSILAGKLAIETGWAINLGGGFHHCCSYKGGGFCPYADITLLIKRVFDEEPQIRTAMIVDLDAHQGNGHERDFARNPNVFILDVYNAAIYPRDHEAKLAIRCAVELQPYTQDDKYLRKVKSSLINSLEQFSPDFVVYNAGTDILKGDSLGLLSITPEAVMERDEFVFKICRQRNIPIVMLLSGGYLKSSAKVIANSISNLKNRGLFN